MHLKENMSNLDDNPNLSWRAVCREEKKTDDPNQVQALALCRE
jgi:hypothetical protein